MTHRDSMAPEVGGLGKKVERRKSEPVRQDEEVAPGIFKSKDGKLYTSIPVNEVANFPVYGWPLIK